MTQAQKTEYKQLLAKKLDSEKIKELFEYVDKLERIAEITAQYCEIVNDSYSTFTEQEYALEKVEEVFQEYQFFIGNKESTQ
tara:strand:- start:60 stop:305 length:246 start_codon:yes stop_codon:yes gene_type:complete